MATFLSKATILTNQIRIKDEFKSEFADWQARFHGSISAFPGFVSLEILSGDGWSLVQRFQNPESLSNWKNSSARQKLMAELKRFQKEEGKEITSGVSNVTEVFMTQVNPDKTAAYRDWMSKIHQAEAKFPGFKGVYVQSPASTHGQNWITLLQFDTPENLDRWLTSPERQAVLRESESLIDSLESHRVISPYAGWFGSIAKGGILPPVWKQTMLVLLVLFPIVMLELKYLSPLTASLNASVAMFIGNAISVTLIAWPMMPIALWFLGWWLTPKDRLETTIIGTCLILLLYLIEILIFYKFS